MTSSKDLGWFRNSKLFQIPISRDAKLGSLIIWKSKAISDLSRLCDLWSLQWWPPRPLFSINPYHQPTLSDLYQTSVRIHSLYCCHPKPSFLSLLSPTKNHTTSTPAYLEPHRLHTHSMLQANHTTHVLEVMSSSHHMVFQGFESASFGKHQSMILSATFPFYYHMLSTITPFILCQYPYKYYSCSM